MIIPENHSTEVEDRLVMVAIDPTNHRDWQMVLPSAMPLFMHYDDDNNPLVRWAMPKEKAQEFGFWGAGCACCGGGVDVESSDVWEFDTNHDQTSWYTDALGATV